MPLGSEVGLGPGHTVLDGTQPPERGTAPRPSIFGPCLLWPNGWTDQDVTWYGGICLGPGHVVLDGDPAHPPKGAHHPLSPHVYCGQTVAHLSCCWAPVLNFLNNSIKNEPILTIVGARNPEKIPHQKLTNLFMSPVKCIQCTLKNSKKSFFGNKSSWMLQLQLDQLSSVRNLVYFLPMRYHLLHLS